MNQFRQSLPDGWIGTTLDEDKESDIEVMAETFSPAERRVNHGCVYTQQILKRQGESPYIFLSKTSSCLVKNLTPRLTPLP